MDNYPWIGYLSIENTVNDATLSHLGTEMKTRLLEHANRSGIKAPQALLPRDLDMETMSDEQFFVSIYHAIRFDQPEELKRLIRDARFGKGMHQQHSHRKPLHYAAENRSLQIMALLLDTDPTEESTMEKVSGMTVWHLAARYGGKESLVLLVTKFGDETPGLTAKSDTGTTPLVEAILGQEQDSALYLFEKTSPSHCDPGDPPMIHLSTAFGMGKLTDRLIERGFDPKVTSPDGAHALFYVNNNTPLELIDGLISRGLSPEDTRRDGRTPLHVLLTLDEKRDPHLPATSSSIDDKVVKKLVSPSVLRMTDEEGNDPWHYFCTAYLQESGLTKSCDELCKMLIDHDVLLLHEQVTGKSAISLLVIYWSDAWLKHRHLSRTQSKFHDLNRAAQLFRRCINHHQALESFLRSNQSTRLLNWCILNWSSLGTHDTLIDILLGKGVSVHTRCTYHKGYSALDIASLGMCLVQTGSLISYCRNDQHSLLLTFWDSSLGQYTSIPESITSRGQRTA